MIVLSSHFVVHNFVLIYVLINIAHGDPQEELFKCYQRIKDAFGNCNLAKECLKYAIKHYVKDQNTPGNSQTVADTYVVVPSFVGQSSTQEEVFEPTSELDTERSNLNKRKKVDPEHVSKYAKRFHKALETMIEETDIFPGKKTGYDYATLYHDALESMISGKGVPKRDEFCKKHYTPALENPKECTDALKQFGNSRIKIVKWAFKSYTLAECQFLRTYFPEYKYITDYMEVIIDQCHTSPSKSPIKFCEAIVKKLHIT